MKMYLFKIVPTTGKAPTKGTDHSAGWDLYSSEDLILSPGKRALINVGFKMELPEGFFGSIRPRSGLAVKHGIDTMAGVIDSDYRGVVGVVLINHGDEDFHIQRDDRIAQMIIQKHYDMRMMLLHELSESKRGSGGFGST